jgi:S1-C subfamily serine protease
MPEEFDTASPSDTSKWSDRFRKLKTLIQRSWLFGAGIIASLLGVLLFSYLYPAPIPLTSSEIGEMVVQTMASATPPPAYSSVVYQIILPSLVYIQTQTERSEDERFGVGSGVIINENGDILTALHVLENAVLIEVIFADGTHATAEIIAAEPENDIAVLHPSQPPEVIVPAVLGSANAMRIGDEAYAVGNPLGLVGSMSAGVISGFNRSIPLNDGENRLDGLIQFDTAVNPGNSGGPLLNRYGQVIGVVTALANPSEQNFFVGIGFAVPIQTAAAAAGAPDY